MISTLLSDQNMDSNDTGLNNTVLCSPSTELLNKSASSSQAYLTVLSGPQTGAYYCIHRKHGAILGSSFKSDMQLSDIGISRKHLRIYWRDSYLFLEDLKSVNGTFINRERIDDAAILSDGDYINIGASTALKLNISSQLDVDYQKTINEQLDRDSLTQAYNRRFLTSQFKKEFAYAKRHRTDLSLLMIDIDHFKGINDNHGHVAGDYVLTHLSHTLRSICRTEDYVCRYGGEEFIIICRDLNSKLALDLGHRIQTAISSSVYRHEEIEIPFTVSVGHSTFPDNEAHSAKEMLQQADDALYEAKRKGRNCIIQYKNS